MLNRYIDFLKKNKISVAITASTGIAATHLNGSTIHSWSGIGIQGGLTDHDLMRIAENKNQAAKIQNAKVLIIDEISMLHSYRLDLVNRVCKYLRLNPEPFGGLQVVLCGDFFQLPPINEPEYPPSSFAFKSSSWEELGLTVCYLDEQHRQNDGVFLKLLNDIRSQEVDEYTYEKLARKITANTNHKLPPTRLYTHNIDVDTINDFELKKLIKPVHIYYMANQGKKHLVEVLKKSCLALQELSLKVGAAVMFIKNNPAKGYINGSLGQVVEFDEDDTPQVQLRSGRIISAAPISWQLEEDDKILAEITQVPLRLAWAITVHKSQGMSLDEAVIDLSKSFAYGMGYVALSRVRTMEGINLLGLNPMALMVDSEVAKFDVLLKKLSRAESLSLNNLSAIQIKKIQSDFLTKINK